MKVTFLTPNLEMHGGNLVMLKYANYLAEQGEEVSIISSDRQTLTGLHPNITLRLYKSFPVRYVDFFLLQKTYYRTIVKLIEECNVLVPIYTPLLPAVIRAKSEKGLNADIIFLFQDFFEMVWAGPWIKRTLSKPSITDHIKLAVCVSQNSEEALKSISNVPTLVIPNGIDDEFYERGLNKEQFLLFVGRPQKPKGFHIFKAVFGQIKEKYPYLQAKVVAPTVDDKTEDGITFVAYKDREQIARLYSQALIYVNTSLGESFGLPALEAMASKTAVVLTDTVGARQYARHGENCLVTEVENVEQTVEAVERLLSDEYLRHTLEENALETAKYYRWQTSLEKFRQVLSASD